RAGRRDPADHHPPRLGTRRIAQLRPQRPPHPLRHRHRWPWRAVGGVDRRAHPPAAHGAGRRCPRTRLGSADPVTMKRQQSRIPLSAVINTRTGASPMKKLVLPALLALTLAACSSPGPENGAASVQDRGTGVATVTAGSAKGSGIAALTDPNNILSKRSVFFDFDSF